MCWPPTATVPAPLPAKMCTGLRAQLLRCGHIGQLALPGLRADKAPVVAGGLSVLLAIFHTLQLQAMVPAQGALRIGVLHSLCTPTA